MARKNDLNNLMNRSHPLFMSLVRWNMSYARTICLCFGLTNQTQFSLAKRAGALILNSHWPVT